MFDFVSVLTKEFSKLHDCWCILFTVQKAIEKGALSKNFDVAALLGILRFTV